MTTESGVGGPSRNCHADTQTVAVPNHGLHRLESAELACGSSGYDARGTPQSAGIRPAARSPQSASQIPAIAAPDTRKMRGDLGLIQNRNIPLLPGPDGCGKDVGEFNTTAEVAEAVALLNRYGVVLVPPELLARQYPLSHIKAVCNRAARIFRNRRVDPGWIVNRLRDGLGATWAHEQAEQAARAAAAPRPSEQPSPLPPEYYRRQHQEWKDSQASPDQPATSVSKADRLVQLKAASPATAGKGLQSKPDSAVQTTSTPLACQTPPEHNTDHAL
jgi:hypothetical protein